MTATWPADWDAMLAGEGCSMCAKGRPDDDGFGVRIQAAKYSDAYLQRADMQRGYTLVIWRGRHVAEPTELEAAEASEYWLEVLRVAEALQRYYRPLKMNYEVLGNSLPHLHTHLVPRYLDDPAPGRPFPFLGIERPNLPEDLVQRDAAALANGTRLELPEPLPEGPDTAIENLGHRFMRVVEVVSARMPTPEEARVLRLGPGTPVVRLLHIDYDADDRPLQVADDLYVGDRHELVFEWTEPENERRE